MGIANEQSLRNAGVWFCLVVSCFGLLTVTSTTASKAQSCDEETTKFVYDSTSSTYTGNRGAIQTYNHLPICPGKATGQTIFMRLDSDYDWVEVGVRQYPTDPSSRTHAWVEWGTFPGPTIGGNFNLDTCCINGGAGFLSTGTTYVLMLTNGPGTTWDFHIAHSSDPTAAPWKKIYSTPNLGNWNGYAEGESSRYGSTDASLHEFRLQGQVSYRGPWRYWGHLGCDYPITSQTDWWAKKVSESEWRNVHQVPPPGGC